MEALKIRGMLEEDWPAVSQIYLQGMLGGNATFTQEVPMWRDWSRNHVHDLRYVAVDRHGKVQGWVAVSPYSRRAVYRGVMEVSIYVSDSAQQSGIGSALMRHLIDSSERLGVWTLYSGIFPENTASIRLHEKHDFVQVGLRERLGKLNGAWRDVCLYERRSKLVGA